MFSKKMAVMLFVCLFCFTFAQAQKTASENETEITVQQTQKETFYSSSSEESFPIQPPSDGLARNTKKMSTFLVFLRMILVLIFIVICMYAVIRFMKNGLEKPESDDPFLRKVSSVSLAPGKTVQVVTLLDKAYLIGVSDSSVNLIGEVQDKELIDAMNLYADKNNSSNRPKNFNDILALFMPNSAENKNIFSESADKASELLKKQRERLHENGRQI